jgi:pilus assembly protein CpaC
MRIRQGIPLMSRTKTLKYIALCSVLLLVANSPVFAKGLNEEAGGLFVPVSRSELVVVPHNIAEVLVADPDIADVHVIGNTRVVFVGKKIGRTNAKLFDRENHIIRQFDVIVGYDLPGIRKALHSFLPQEHIGVELVNTSVALTGKISDASVGEEALKIVSEFVRPSSGGQGGLAGAVSAVAGQNSGQGSGASSPILNLMKVTSGQQVMLRVRVGEIKRSALKNLGVQLGAFKNTSNGQIVAGSQGGQQAFISPSTASSVPFGGLFTPASELTSGGVLSGFFKNGDVGLSATLNALESDGILKMLAEPNLVAMSGEKAEFLAGGEFPVPVAQATSSGGAINTIQFQQFGVSVQFIPYVLSDNRIRLSVMPEVSEIDTSTSTVSNNTSIPGLTSRRAKTTVELAPGESFMIAGLIQDSLNSSISQIPGASEIPILGALLRNTSFQREETELVIAVTPYIVDPLKSSDVRLPTDDFRPANDMERFFYGVLGSMSGNAYRLSQTPSLEGPIGFMTD